MKTTDRNLEKTSDLREKKDNWQIQSEILMLTYRRKDKNSVEKSMDQILSLIHASIPLLSHEGLTIT